MLSTHSYSHSLTYTHCLSLSHTYTHTHRLAQKHTHTHTHIQKHILTRTCTQTLTHTHTHTLTHTHAGPQCCLHEDIIVYCILCTPSGGVWPCCPHAHEPQNQSPLFASAAMFCIPCYPKALALFSRRACNVLYGQAALWSCILSRTTSSENTTLCFFFCVRVCVRVCVSVCLCGSTRAVSYRRSRLRCLHSA